MTIIKTKKPLKGLFGIIKKRDDQIFVIAVKPRMIK